MKKVFDVCGRRIYSDQGNYVGSVEDVLIDDGEGAIVGLVFKQGKAIPYDSITAIGEIVLVRTRKAEEVY